MIMADTAYTPEEIAQRLKITPRMAAEHLRLKNIPGGYKVHGQWRIDASDLERYITEQKQKAAQTGE